ncbi:MAG: hypothetical protein K9M80_01835 [Candidatus Marinimicrobia bacterium]|nr:hypothetical protein [Candidatus Neomarinimicrobiota bacterium]
MKNISKYCIFPVVVSLLLISGGVYYFYHNNDNELVEQYEDKISSLEKKANEYKRIIEEKDSVYQIQIAVYRNNVDSLKNLVQVKKGEITKLSKYYETLSNDSSVKELEENLNVELTVTGSKEYVYLPIRKTQVINYEFALNDRLEFINTRQENIIAYQDSIIDKDSIHMENLKNEFNNLYFVNDSLIDLSRDINLDLDKAINKNKKLRKWNTWLIGGVIIEAGIITLLIIK